MRDTFSDAEGLFFSTNFSNSAYFLRPANLYSFELRCFARKNGPEAFENRGIALPAIRIAVQVCRGLTSFRIILRAKIAGRASGDCLSASFALRPSAAESSSAGDLDPGGAVAAAIIIHRRIGRSHISRELKIRAVFNSSSRSGFIEKFSPSVLLRLERKICNLEGVLFQPRPRKYPRRRPRGFQAPALSCQIYLSALFYTQFCPRLDFLYLNGVIKTEFANTILNNIDE